MACVTACPSGVRYDKLIEDTRAAGRAPRRPPARRAALPAAACSRLFPHPARLRALVPLLAAGRRLGLVARCSLAPLARCPRLRALARAGAARRRCARRLRRLPEVTPARGTGAGARRAAPGLRPARLLRPTSTRRRSRVLAAEGFEVHAPRAPRCCGALQLHAGATDAARELAQARRSRRSRATSRGRDQRRRLRLGDEGLRAPAARRPRVGRARRGVRGEGRATSPSCSPSDEPRAPRAPARGCASPTTTPATSPTPRACARSRASCCGRSPASSCVEPAGWEICCGSAGIYNLLEPEPAARARARARPRTCSPPAPRRSPPPTPAARCRSRRTPSELGRPLPVYHPVELLHASIEGTGDGHRDGRCDEGVEIRGHRRTGRARRGPRRRRAGASSPTCTRASSAAPARAAARAAPSARRGWTPAARSTSSPRRAAIREGDWQRRAAAARPARPARRDHRPDRPQDGDQRAQLGRARASWPTSRTPTRRRGRTWSAARST